ncbi:hypothetical protein [Halpernia sp. GG3]
MIRPFRRRSGEDLMVKMANIPKAGEFIYDRPFLLGF